VDYVAIKRASSDSILLARARWCVGFFCKLRGLTFRRRLGMDDALVLVHAANSRTATSIHMMFVFCPMAAIWINSAGEVIECRLAKPFHPLYSARAPARYVLEGPPALLDAFRPGDRVRFEPIAP
jgi:uncharacterized membrane protein (UPF0127 family)